MNRRTLTSAALIALGSLVLVLALVCLWPTAPPERSAAVSTSAAPTVSPVGLQRPSSPPPPQPVDEQIDPLVPLTGQIAEALDEGWIRCRFEESHEGDSLGINLSYVTWLGPWMTAVVPSPENTVLIHHELALEDSGVDSAPLALLSWGDATPGQQGWCTVEAPTQATLTARFSDPSGLPLSHADVKLCYEDRVTDAQGMAHYLGWVTESCAVSLPGAWVSMGGSEPAASHSVEVPPDGITVEVVSAEAPPRRPREKVSLENTVEELEALYADFSRVDPLAPLLADPAVKGVARTQLEQWAADRARIEAWFTAELAAARAREARDP